MSLFKINEIFQTIQGEGFFTGVPSIFIRLQGCPVECAWCDTKQTWAIEPENEIDANLLLKKQSDSPSWTQMTTGYILDYVLSHYSAKHIVITGGEPCIYDLLDLTKKFEEHGFTCQIETSGTYPILATGTTWVTVSPKIAMRGKLKVLKEALMRANEIKHPVGTEKDIEKLDNLLKGIDTSNKQIALQPISQKSSATQLCIDTCIKRNWRLSVQMHKYLDIE